MTNLLKIILNEIDRELVTPILKDGVVSKFFLENSNDTNKIKKWILFNFIFNVDNIHLNYSEQLDDSLVNTVITLIADKVYNVNLQKNKNRDKIKK